MITKEIGPGGNRADSQELAVTAHNSTALPPIGGPEDEAFLAGYAHGALSRQAEIDRLNYEADLWFWCYTNRKNPSEFNRHATNRLWEAAA